MGVKRIFRGFALALRGDEGQWWAETEVDSAGLKSAVSVLVIPGLSYA